MFYRNLTSSLLAAILLALIACGENANTSNNSAESQKLRAFKITHCRLTDPSPNPTEKQTLQIATKDFANILDPHNTESGGDTKVIIQIYETLLQIDPQNTDQLIPQLATRWQIAPDNLSITFDIKPNVKFHDGSILDAQVCKASLQRLLGDYLPAPEAPYKNFFDFIKSIDAQKLTLTIHLNRPVPRVALRNLTMFPASIVSKKLLEATEPLNSKARTRFISDWASGTGAFYLTQFAPSQGRVNLRAFSDYHGGKPQIKGILFQQIKDSNTQIESLTAGQTQLLDDPPRPIWQTLEANPKVTLHKWWALNLCYLGINTKHEKTKNITLRKAIRTAINRDELAQLYYGTARETYSLVAQPLAEYDPNYRADGSFPSPLHRYNAASALIEQARAKGKKLTIYYPVDDRPYLPTPSKVADKIRQQLNAVGLDVTIQSVPNSELFSSIRDEKYELVLLGWMTDNADPDNFYIPLASGDIKTQTPSTTNVGRVFDAALHQKLLQAQAITDQTKRVQTYRAIEKQYQEKYIGYVPLLNTQQGLAYTNRLKNIQVNPLGQYRFHRATLKED